MANNKVKFLRGTTEEYQALTVKDPDTLYVITDESENSDIINDTLISQTTTWSSQKIHDSLNASAGGGSAFSVEVATWTTLAEQFAGCGYSAEVAAEGVTAADFPDVYFDSASFEAAANSGIIAATTDGKIILYAKSVPAAALSGTYFVRKGATE